MSEDLIREIIGTLNDFASYAESEYTPYDEKYLRDLANRVDAANKQG